MEEERIEEYDFGMRLKELRKRKNYTQKELGSMLEVESQTIHRYENNTQKPTTEKMILLASALDTSLDYLAGREKGQPIYVEGLSQKDLKCLMYLVDIMKKATKEKAKPKPKPKKQK